MSKQQARETLSAVLDGEAAELEARRSLRDLENDDLATLARWQLARDVMARHPVARVPEGFNSRLATALEQERQGSAGVTGHLARVGVAASVAMATVLGWQYWSAGDQPQQAMVASAPTEEVRQVAPGARPLIEPALVAQGARQRDSGVRARPAGQLSPMLVRHSEMAARHGAQGMTPFVRLVSMDAKQTQQERR